MSTMSKKRVWIVAGVTGAVLLSLALAQESSRAEEKAPAIVVGTYEPATIAQQSGLQEKMQEKMMGLRERMQGAQQSGDQAAMQQIQTEAQEIQQQIIQDFTASIEAALPKVAEETGVQVIAIEVTYTAPGIEKKEITKEIAAAMGLKAPAEEISIPVPAPSPAAQ